MRSILHRTGLRPTIMLLQRLGSVRTEAQGNWLSPEECRHDYEAAGYDPD